MGIRVSIHKAKGYEQCSNGGLSSLFDEVTIVNVDGPAEPSANAPAVLLVNGPLGTVNARPAADQHKLLGSTHCERWVEAKRNDAVGPMMGGSYIGTSDSRFGDKVREMLGHGFYGAVPFHDRFETTEEYALND